MQSEAAQVADYFSRAAEAFDSLYSEEKQSNLMRWINRKFRRDIYDRFRLTLEHVERCGAKTALDVGCGSGRYCQALAQMGLSRILGVDASLGILQLAKQNCKGLSNVEFRYQDLMLFESQAKFDVVIAMGLFDYLNDAPAALSHMRKFANRCILASFPSVNWYRTPIRKVRYFFKRCPVRVYHRQDIEETARLSGFQKYEITKIPGAGQDYFVCLWI
jgi:2-polyprenyl-3-methyl-5-hydroxy-6-metoxy-1,4-benzoquinol methylase